LLKSGVFQLNIHICYPTGSRTIDLIQLIVWATDPRDFNSIIALKVICVDAPLNRAASNKVLLLKTTSGGPGWGPTDRSVAQDENCWLSRAVVEYT